MAGDTESEAGDRGDEPVVIDGRVVDFSGLTYVAGAEVGIALTDVDGNATSVLTTTDDNGEFAMEIPAGRFVSASVRVALEGVAPIELDIEDGRILAGEVVLVVPADIGSHLRFGG